MYKKPTAVPLTASIEAVDTLRCLCDDPRRNGVNVVVLEGTWLSEAENVRDVVTMAGGISFVRVGRERTSRIAFSVAGFLVDGRG
jgi:hypothetical protein